MSQGRGRTSRLLFFVIAGAVGILLITVPAELAVRLVAAISPETRYFAARREGELRRRFGSLQEYLATQSLHLVPHRRWFNYWTNAQGFNDEEFVVPKPAGRFRIMAVGDSFTFGLVPYPQNVMTLVEASLRAACPNRDLDLLNFGIAGANVADYRTVVELGYATYDPDLVLVNVYVGNDTPDLYHRPTGGLSLRRLLHHSYLWNYLRNVLVLRRSIPAAGSLIGSVQGPAPSGDTGGESPRGGHIVDPRYRMLDDDPALVGPVLDEKVYRRIVADEMGRFYVPPDAREIDEAWRATLEQLEVARLHVTERGGRLVIALYPSVLQIDARLRSEVIDQLHGQPRDGRITPDAIDPRLPNRVLLAYCREHGLACQDLTPVLDRASRESVEPLYKAREPHWTPRGNRVAAEAQAPFLAPLVCGTTAARQEAGQR
jgi:hypothetical protein